MVEEPIPDGMLHIVFKDAPWEGYRADPQGFVRPPELAILFRDIRGWQPEAWGVKVMYKDRVVVYPWHNILRFTTHKNSQEYQDALIAYEEQSQKLTHDG